MLSCISMVCTLAVNCVPVTVRLPCTVRLDVVMMGALSAISLVAPITTRPPVPDDWMSTTELSPETATLTPLVDVRLVTPIPVVLTLMDWSVSARIAMESDSVPSTGVSPKYKVFCDMWIVSIHASLKCRLELPIIWTALVDGMILEETIMSVCANTLDDVAIITGVPPAAIPIVLEPALKMPVSVSCANDIEGVAAAPGNARSPLMGAFSLWIKLDVDCDCDAISVKRNIVT